MIKVLVENKQRISQQNLDGNEVDYDFIDALIHSIFNYLSIGYDQV